MIIEFWIMPYKNYCSSGSGYGSRYSDFVYSCQISVKNDFRVPLVGEGTIVPNGDSGERMIVEHSTTGYVLSPGTTEYDIKIRLDLVRFDGDRCSDRVGVDALMRFNNLEPGVPQ